MIATIGVIDTGAMIATIATATGAAIATIGTLIATTIVVIFGATIVTAIGVTENATIGIETNSNPTKLAHREPVSEGGETGSRGHLSVETA